MKQRNKHLVKLLSLVLCAALLCGGVGALAYSAGVKDAGPEPAESPAAPAQSAAADASGEVRKDETVYVIADASGAAKKVIVSDWLQNAAGSATLADVSALENITNLKGEETYTANGDTRVWDAAGKDIYYQGETDLELPVSLAVSYYLDGRAVTAEQLAGKSGHVTIRFDYTNTQYTLVEIDGKMKKIYVPFAMLTGLMLDNDAFRNVEVSNGKLINDGDRTIVIGLALPGLAENLQLNEETLPLPDYVEISADVTNFSLLTTMTLATNEVFNNFDFQDINDADGLSASLNELTGAMEQLLDGSSALYGGLTELLTKSGELTAGIDRLAAGAAQLSDGADALGSGAAAIQDGAAELAGGLAALTENSPVLVDGASQVFQTLLATADAQLAAAGLQVEKLTIENYASVLDQLLASLDTPAVSSLAALKTQLDSYNQFYQGLVTYTAGVGAANTGAQALQAGADTLRSGADALQAGADTLSSGLGTLQSGSNALVEGVEQLQTGAMQLNAGLQTFYDEGVKKLADAVDDGLGGLLPRLRATLDVSRDYKTFSGIRDGMDGSVRFIYRTDTIEAPAD